MKRKLLILIMGVVMVIEKGQSQTMQEKASKEESSAREFVKVSQKSQGILLSRISPVI